MRPPIWSEEAESGTSAVTWCNWWKASEERGTGAGSWERKPSAQEPIWMCCAMLGSSLRTQGSDQRLRSALSSAVTGIVIATGRSTATTAATFVVGIALTSVVASAIAAVFPAP